MEKGKEKKVTAGAPATLTKKGQHMVSNFYWGVQVSNSIAIY